MLAEVDTVAKAHSYVDANVHQQLYAWNPMLDTRPRQHATWASQDILTSVLGSMEISISAGACIGLVHHVAPIHIYAYRTLANKRQLRSLQDLPYQFLKCLHSSTL